MLCGCAVQPAIRAYKIADMEIRIYPNSEVLAQHLPPNPFLVAMSSIKGFSLEGYVERDRKIIHAVDNVGAVLHEVKHYLEPEWGHSAVCDRTTLCLESSRIGEPTKDEVRGRLKLTKPHISADNSSFIEKTNRTFCLVPDISATAK